MVIIFTMFGFKNEHFFLLWCYRAMAVTAELGFRFHTLMLTNKSEYVIGNGLPDDSFWFDSFDWFGHPRALCTKENAFMHFNLIQDSFCVNEFRKWPQCDTRKQSDSAFITHPGVQLLGSWLLPWAFPQWLPLQKISMVYSSVPFYFHFFFISCKNDLWVEHDRKKRKDSLIAAPSIWLWHESLKWEECNIKMYLKTMIL